MESKRRLVFAVICVALVTLGMLHQSAAISCDAWDQDEDILVEGGIGKVNGMGLKYHPQNPRTGEYDLETYIAWKLGNFEETDSHVNMRSKCDIEDKYPSEINATVYRAMSIADLECQITRGTRVLAPGVTQTYIRLNATWSPYPDFSLVLEISSVNANHTEDLGTSPRTDGYSYIIDQAYVFPMPILTFYFFFHSETWTTLRDLEK
jgi:hypothetical protein